VEAALQLTATNNQLSAELRMGRVLACSKQCSCTSEPAKRSKPFASLSFVHSVVPQTLLFLHDWNPIKTSGFFRSKHHGIGEAFPIGLDRAVMSVDPARFDWN